MSKSTHPCLHPFAKFAAQPRRAASNTARDISETVLRRFAIAYWSLQVQSYKRARDRAARVACRLLDKALMPADTC